MSETKKCPQCAEMVQGEAKICRFCSYNFTTKQSARPPKNSLQSCGGILAWMVAGVVILIAIGNSFGGQESEPEKPVAMLTADARAACTKLLKAGEANGIIKGRSYEDKTRLDVDEVAWALLPADQKTALLAAVSCEVHGVSYTDLALTQRAPVAYGYRSGKRLAMLSSVGMSYE